MATLQVPANDTSFFGHPRGLATLFFTEMWERFSYYGMRALLVLFMTASVERGGLGFGDARATAIYGLYTSIVYLLGVPGGWAADRILGQQRAVLYGGVIIALGHFSMAFPSLASFYFGLTLIVIGTGLLKPNASTMVGQLYAEGDQRRDAAFSIYYMGINLGAFISPLVCGYLGERVNWHYGFAAAGVGMVLGIVQFLAGRRYLPAVSAAPVPLRNAAEATTQQWQLRLGLLIGASLVGVTVLAMSTGYLTLEGLSNGFGVLLIGLTLAIFAWLYFGSDWNAIERRRLLAILALFIASVLFWSAFEQAGSTLNLFAERNTDRVMFGTEQPASYFQSLNSLFLITLAPMMAWLWLRLGRRDPSSPIKFSIGLVLVGLGLVVLVPVAAAKGVSPWFLTLTYLLHTIGELCLSPVGMSATTALAPARAAGLMMGIWFLSISVGNYFAGRLASASEAYPLAQVFSWTAAFCIGLGIVLALAAKPIKRLMGGAE